MNYYTKLVIVVLIVIAGAQVAPRAVNILLGLVLVGMLVMQSSRYASLIAQLKL